MSVEKKIDEIIKKIQEVESQLKEIKNNITKINDKLSSIENLTSPDSYLKDYSIKRLGGINSELQNAIEFLGRDENLVDQVKVKRYFEEFSSRLASLTLMFELYYAFRIAHLFGYTDADASDLIVVDRFLEGFYIPKDSFEKFIDEKDYISVRTELSRIKDKFNKVSDVWMKVYR